MAKHMKQTLLLLMFLQSEVSVANSKQCICSEADLDLKKFCDYYRTLVIIINGYCYGTSIDYHMLLFVWGEKFHVFVDR